MEWLTVIKDAIEYMEQNLLTVTGPEEVAKHAHISTIYLQRGFQVLTGYTLGEYIRNRRLFEAGLKLTQTDEKVIDIALEYGYETPESFTKAFTRFHGTTPIEVRRDRSKMQLFLPLHVSIKIQGGSKMNYTVEKTEAFTVIGFERLFSFETSYKEIPDFWTEMYKIHAPNILAGKGPKTEVEHAIMENYIGEFGVCIEDAPAPGKFRYMIAGPYQGGKVPQGMKLYTRARKHVGKIRVRRHTAERHAEREHQDLERVAARQQGVRPCRQVQHRVVFRRRRPEQHRLRVRYLDPPYPEKVKSYHAIRKLPCRCAKRQGISYFMSVPG